MARFSVLSRAGPRLRPLRPPPRAPYERKAPKIGAKFDIKKKKKKKLLRCRKKN